MRQQAFENCIQANLIIAPDGGQILLANKAACKLLGYSKKELESTSSDRIFDSNEPAFKKMHDEKMLTGSGTGFISAFKKNGKRLPCQVSSASFFSLKQHPVIITSIIDLRQMILVQKNIDNIKELAVANDIKIAINKQKTIDINNNRIVALHLEIASKRQKKIDDRQHALNVKQIKDARQDARETERSDIGKELHDNVNQLLSASKMYLELGKRGGENSEEYFNKSSEYTLTAIEEIRKLTRGLITDIIKNMGLTQAVENLCRDTMEITPLTISADLEKFAEEGTDEKFKLNIFRIIQEQLTNIIKHAGATVVNILLAKQKGITTLTVTDNGIGFNTTKANIGVGIENIKSRAAQYNGSARFRSSPGKGCSLAVKFSDQV